jgi:hypothetical protein
MKKEATVLTAFYVCYAALPANSEIDAAVSLSSIRAFDDQHEPAPGTSVATDTTT